jgi:hypothetical protein
MTASTPPPWLRAELDQALAFRTQARADAPLAEAEARCALPPVGCGQPIRPSLARGFRDQASRDEHRITGLCQGCQDEMFAPPPEEVEAMAADLYGYGRCGDCGRYRRYEHVDIGVGTITGFDCCPIPVAVADRLPSCTKTKGCWLSQDHAHGCDTDPGDGTWGRYTGANRDRRGG